MRGCSNIGGGAGPKAVLGVDLPGGRPSCTGLRSITPGNLFETETSAGAFRRRRNGRKTDIRKKQ